MHPRFAALVDAEENANRPRDGEGSARLDSILSALSTEDSRLFSSLRDTCLKLADLARDMKGDAEDRSGISELQLDGVNRLLWIYLKALRAKSAMEEFLGTIDADEIERDIARSQADLAAIGDQPADAAKRKSIEDTLATSRQRLENYRHTKESYDFLCLERKRLHTKIAGLAEAGVRGQSAGRLTSEIDVVSASVLDTEKAMRGLDFIAAIPTVDDEPPALLVPSRVGRRARTGRN